MFVVDLNPEVYRLETITHARTRTRARPCLILTLMRRLVAPTLLACPAAVLYNWRKEFQTWAHFRLGTCQSGGKEEVGFWLRS